MNEDAIAALIEFLCHLSDTDRAVVLGGFCGSCHNFTGEDKCDCAPVHEER